MYPRLAPRKFPRRLGGVEISEQSNVSKVLAAVVEGSSEVGTTYYSDTYGYEDKIQILEKVPYDLTGNVIYPIAQIKNEETSQEEQDAAKDFLAFRNFRQMLRPLFQKVLFWYQRRIMMNELLEGLRSLDWSPFVDIPKDSLYHYWWYAFFLGIFLAQKLGKWKEPWQSIAAAS